MKKIAYFAGGCFWCIASSFRNLTGVVDIISGYIGEDNILPTYELVKSQKTNYREAIKIIYEDSLIKYEDLLEEYLNNVDYLDSEGQYIDKGHSYTLAIYYTNESEKDIVISRINKLKEIEKEIYISIEEFKNFYEAEEYHQDYDIKNPKEMNEELIKSGRKVMLFTKNDLSIRYTRNEDLPKVMEIFSNARKFMKENGNGDQWGDNWPPQYKIEEDILSNISYVVVDSNDEILATFMLYYGEDPTYLEVREGAWISNKEYGTIHRLASSFSRKGLFPFVVEFALLKGLNLRADTHENNIPMRKSLEKAGFKYCGIISPIEGGDRVAYELVINK